jgi:hypothetical protein
MTTRSTQLSYLRAVTAITSGVAAVAGWIGYLLRPSDGLLLVAASWTVCASGWAVLLVAKR